MPTCITRRDLPLDDEKGKERAKEEIGYLQEVTSPDVLGMVVQERRPILPYPNRPSQEHEKDAISIRT